MEMAAGRAVSELLPSSMYLLSICTGPEALVPSYTPRGAGLDWLPQLTMLSSRQLRAFLRPGLSKRLLNESVTRGAVAAGLTIAIVSATSPVSPHPVDHDVLCSWARVVGRDWLTKGGERQLQGARRDPPASPLLLPSLASSGLTPRQDWLPSG